MKPTQRFVTAPDGVRLAVYEAGPADGVPIVFIHGFGQSGLSWLRQFDSPLVESCRLIAFDLRGHAASDKPLDKAVYQSGATWADDLAAVIASIDGGRRVVLVPWSFGGGVVGEYLAKHGAGRVAAINFCAASTRMAPEWIGPGRFNVKDTMSEDPQVNIPGVKAFIRGCFEVEPSAADLEFMLGFNMMMPPRVRAMVSGRPFDFEQALRALTVPVLVTHGTADRMVLPAMGEHTASVVPGARLSVYEGIGHCPFWEDAARFNAELAALVRSVS